MFQLVALVYFSSIRMIFFLVFAPVDTRRRRHCRRRHVSLHNSPAGHVTPPAIDLVMVSLQRKNAGMDVLQQLLLLHCLFCTHHHHHQVMSTAPPSVSSLCFPSINRIRAPAATSIRIYSAATLSFLICWRNNNYQRPRVSSVFEKSFLFFFSSIGCVFFASFVFLKISGLMSFFIASPRLGRR